MPLYPVSPVEPFSKLMKLIAAGNLSESAAMFAYLLWVTVGYCLGVFMPISTEIIATAGPAIPKNADTIIDPDPVDEEAVQAMGSVLAKLDNQTPVAIEHIDGVVVAGAAPTFPVPPLLLKSIIMWAAERLAEIIVRKFSEEAKS